MAQIDYRDPEWVAEQLGLDKNTVYKYLQDGTIPALQLGRKWLISETRLAEWLDAQAQRQSQVRREAAASAESTARGMAAYSPRAQQAIRAAHAEARRYGHGFLGQEHILLALSADPDCAAGKAMAAVGVSAESLRAEFESRLPPGDATVAGRISRSPGAKRAMRLATQQAEQMRSDKVGTEHLLLGIIKTGQGPARDILGGVGVTFQSVAEQISAGGP